MGDELREVGNCWDFKSILRTDIHVPGGSVAGISRDEAGHSDGQCAVVDWESRARPAKRD